MKLLRRLFLTLLPLLLCAVSAFSQSEVWTLPNQTFRGDNSNSDFLPLGTVPGWAPDLYEGEEATNAHAAFSDPEGNLMFWTQNGRLYDQDGVVIGRLRKGNNETDLRKAKSEVLILPMGRDCSRFAIIFAGCDRENGWCLANDMRSKLFMAIYDRDEPHFDGEATGQMEYTGAPEFPNYWNTLVDIGERDYNLHGIFPAPEALGNVGEALYIGLAATPLIDDCEYKVFVGTERHIYRYSLDSLGFHYDNYTYTTPFQDERTSSFVAEMELKRVDSSLYRLAMPFASASHLTFPLGREYGQAYMMADVETSNWQVYPPSVQFAPLEDPTFPNATEQSDPKGAEWDPTGRYLYIIADDRSYLPEPGPLLVWDTQTEEYVELPALADIDDFEYSYIESYGGNLYLASRDAIARITNPSNPGSLGWDPDFIPITPGYVNSPFGEDPLWSELIRRMLPEQVDDMDYRDALTANCDCCEKYSEYDEKVVNVNSNATWTALNNPFGSAEVNIRDEIRIKAGVQLTIEDMTFRFSPDAKVVIESGVAATSTPGASLTMDNTVFTVDPRCFNKTKTCEGGECGFKLWQGVRILGQPALNQTGGISSPQGRLTMRNSSVIEYAVVGALAGEDLSDNSKCGGIINAKQSTFRNNLDGALFRPYVRTSSGNEVMTLSTFDRCTFITDTDFPYSKYKPRYHVAIISSSGVAIRGCDFSNTNGAQIAYDDRGVGVYSSSARVLVTSACNLPGSAACSTESESEDYKQSTFEHLNYGVYAIAKNSPRPVQILWNEFDLNFTGIFTDGVGNLEVLDNRIGVPSLGFLNFGESGTGLHMVTTTNFEVQNNLIEHYGPTLQTKTGVGVIVTNSGPNLNYLYRNVIEDMYIGVAVKGTNANAIVDAQQNYAYFEGLRFKCNVFNDVRLFDIHLLSGTTTVSDEQGFCNAASGVALTTRPAGNLFSHRGPGTYGWYSSSSAPTLEVDYHHHSNTSTFPRLIPEVGGYTPDLELVLCTNPDITFSAKQSCPVMRLGTPFGSPGYIKSNEDVEALLADAVEKQEELDETGIEEATEELRNEAALLWHQAVMSVMLDTSATVSHAELAETLNELQPVWMEQTASQLNEQLGIASSWGILAQDVSGELSQLTVAGGIVDVSQTDYFSNYETVMAYNQAHMDALQVYQPAYEELPSLDDSKSIANTSVENVSFRVYPNPSKGEVFLQREYSAEASPSASSRTWVEVFDLPGKLVYSMQWPHESKQIVIPAGALPKGYLTFRIMEDGAVQERGKIQIY